jgi:hypothetical protein
MCYKSDIDKNYVVVKRFPTLSYRVYFSLHHVNSIRRDNETTILFLRIAIGKSSTIWLAKVMCQLAPDLPKVRTFGSHFLKDARKLFPLDDSTFCPYEIYQTVHLYWL